MRFENVGMNSGVVSRLENALMQDVELRSADGEGGRNLQQEMSLLTNMLNRQSNGTTAQTSDQTITTLENALAKDITKELRSGDGNSRRVGEEMNLLSTLLEQSQWIGLGQS